MNHSRPLPRRTLGASLLAMVAIAALGTGCTDNNASSTAPGAVTIKVTSTDTACTLSASGAPSGNLVFQVANTGTSATEFYLLAADGVRVVGEVEDIGPGLTRQLTVTATPGSYIAACKPGMKGDGIRTPFVVTATPTSQG